MKMQPIIRIKLAGHKENDLLSAPFLAGGFSASPSKERVGEGTDRNPSDGHMFRSI